MSAPKNSSQVKSTVLSGGSNTWTGVAIILSTTDVILCDPSRVVPSINSDQLDEPEELEAFIRYWYEDKFKSPISV